MKQVCVFSDTDSCIVGPGLPHFTAGYMHNRARDTFIALSNLTGRYKEDR